ncbi:MAG: flagellar hook-basal body complex protein [Caulobacteraceae bacterium]|nr:flagellar hook-basal body complex protein [Caulobacteraceae bacterium]
MLGSIYIGLSGMDAYAQGLQTISNNVANLNTLGYKSATTSFSDVYNQGNGGLTAFTDTASQQSGDGVRYGQPQINFTEGTLRQTTGDLDLAIQGNGFLTLTDGTNTFYTRTGQFAVGDDGYIALQGTKQRLVLLDTTGHAVTVNINDKKTSAPVATTNITFANNLSSSGTDATVSSINVYDSAGAKHVWQVALHAAGSTAPNQWQVTVTDDTGATVGTSTLKFGGGVVDPATAKLTMSQTPTGAAALSVVLDFSSVTSFSSGTTSTISAGKVDGNALGVLSSVTTDTNGQVTLTYSNSKTVTVGAVALANFANPQNLQRVGNSLFRNPTGTQPTLLTSGADGVGQLLSKQLETSNVDLSQEFGDLILVQRGFQASSQVVSTANDMIQELFGMRGHG